MDKDKNTIFGYQYFYFSPSIQEGECCFNIKYYSLGWGETYKNIGSCNIEHIGLTTLDGIISKIEIRTRTYCSLLEELKIIYGNNPVSYYNKDVDEWCASKIDCHFDYLDNNKISKVHEWRSKNYILSYIMYDYTEWSRGLEYLSPTDSDGIVHQGKKPENKRNRYAVISFRLKGIDAEIKSIILNESNRIYEEKLSKSIENF